MMSLRIGGLTRKINFTKNKIMKTVLIIIFLGSVVLCIVLNFTEGTEQLELLIKQNGICAILWLIYLEVKENND